jgi:hypothetical protein
VVGNFGLMEFFSLRQTLAVLNPMSNVDQHMMDDSDVAGPILFCLLFGAFLLLVGDALIDIMGAIVPRACLLTFLCCSDLVRQGAFRLYLRCRPAWIHFTTPYS